MRVIGLKGGCLGIMILGYSSLAHGMSFSGPMFANNVTVTGPVTMSSMTVSTFTVSSDLDVSGCAMGIPERFIQLQSSWTTLNSATASSTFTAVGNMTVS